MANGRGKGFKYKKWVDKIKISPCIRKLMQSAILFLAVKLKFNAISHLISRHEGGEGWTQDCGPTFARFSRVFEMADCINFDFSPWN